MSWTLVMVHFLPDRVSPIIRPSYVHTYSVYWSLRSLFLVFFNRSVRFYLRFIDDDIVIVHFIFCFIFFKSCFSLHKQELDLCRRKVSHSVQSIRGSFEIIRDFRNYQYCKVTYLPCSLKRNVMLFGKW